MEKVCYILVYRLTSTQLINCICIGYISHKKIFKIFQFICYKSVYCIQYDPFRYCFITRILSQIKYLKEYEKLQYYSTQISNRIRRREYFVILRADKMIPMLKSFSIERNPIFWYYHFTKCKFSLASFFISYGFIDRIQIFYSCESLLFAVHSRFSYNETLRYFCISFKQESEFK